MFAQILIGSLLNVLTTADCGGALTGCEPRPTEGFVAISHDKGEEYALDNSTGRTCLTANVSGGYRLSPSIFLDGSARYRLTSEADHTGTAFMVTDDLRPFDIVIDNPGNNNTHTFDFSAAAGWRLSDHVSVGAKATYSVADRARTKDLRYADFYMDLNASAGLSLNYGIFDIAANAIYRRTVESIAFSRAGTNDIVYTPLIDYGNGLGIRESYNGTGFTDDTTQPLLSEYGGVSLQAEAHPCDGVRVFWAGRFAHRTGYYGRDSQYTIIHDKFRGNCWNFVLATQFATSIIQAQCRIDDLVNFRTNYLSQFIDGVTYYEYYEPTKTAVKMRISGDLSYTGYFQKLDDGVYGWRLNAGATFCRNRVTAWVYPLSSASDCIVFRSHISLQRAFPLGRERMLTAEGCAAYQTTWGDFIPDYNMYTRKGPDFSARLQYTLPKMKSLGLRPAIFAGAHTLHRYLECGLSISIYSLKNK